MKNSNEGNEVKTACEHSWRHLQSRQWKNHDREWSAYHRRDEFYCTKCLAIKAISHDQENASPKPDWYTAA